MNITTSGDTDMKNSDILLAYKDAEQIVQDHAYMAQDAIEQRGLDFETARDMGIGAVPGYAEFIDLMEKQGYNPEFLRDIGLADPNLFHDRVLLFAIHNEYGQPIAFVARNLDYRDGDPTSPAKFWNTRSTEIYQKKKVLYNLHRALRERGPLWIVEGYTDTVVMYLAGRRNVVGLGGTAFTDEHLILLETLGIHEIIFCLDGDQAGRAAQESAIEKCKAHQGLEVRVVALSDEEDPDDVIRRGGLEALDAYPPMDTFAYRLSQSGPLTAAQIERQVMPVIAGEPSSLRREEMLNMLHESSGFPVAALRETLAGYLVPTAPPESSPPVPEIPVELPIIQCDDRPLPEISAEAISALITRNDPPEIYRHEDSLVTVNGTHMEMMTKDHLHYRLVRAARFQRSKRIGSPHREVVPDIMEGPADHRFPILTSVVSCPVFSPDGKLIAVPGYHADSAVLLVDTGLGRFDDIPLNPTDREIKEVVQALFEPFVDMPFVDTASKAHTASLTLQPFVRRMIHGPTPLHLVNAPLLGAGTGKGLLTRCATYPYLGRDIEATSSDTSEEEWRKRLTSLLMKKVSHVLLDNAQNRLSSSHLAAAITSPVWSDRILSLSKMVSVAVDCAWIATGNNLVLSRELERRSVWIRLDAGVPEPWKRDHFVYPDLPAWVRSHRRDLVHASLMLIQGWVAAGMPLWKEFDSGAIPLGSFEAWSNVMGGILGIAGIPGFLCQDTPAHPVSTIEQVVKIWAEHFPSQPIGIKKLIPIIKEEAVACEVLGSGAEQSQAIHIGKFISKYVDHEIGGWRIEDAGRYQRAAQYRLVPAKTR